MAKITNFEKVKGVFEKETVADDKTVTFVAESVSKKSKVVMVESNVYPGVSIALRLSENVEGLRKNNELKVNVETGEVTLADPSTAARVKTPSATKSKASSTASTNNGNKAVRRGCSDRSHIIY